MQRLNQMLIILVALLGATMHLITHADAADKMTVTAEAAEVMTKASLADFTLGVENFDAATLANNAIASTFEGKAASAAYAGTMTLEDSTAGDGAGTTGKHLKVTAATVTLTLGQDLQYFGMWISKLDGGLTVTFYDGTATVQAFSNVDIIAKFVGDNYKKNPTISPRAVGTEYYGFVNFQCVGDSKFNKVEIKADTAKTVATDNHTIGYKTKMLAPTVEKPKVYQTTHTTGLIQAVENFDAATVGKIVEATPLASKFGGTEKDLTGSYALGEIKASGDDGGAGKTGRYLETAKETTTTLIAGRELQYFGMWVSKLSAGLTVTFYKKDDKKEEKVQEFTTAEIAKSFTEEHKKNPNTDGTKTDEGYFGFVNFVCADKTTFNKVVIKATGADIFTDNHTIGYKGTKEKPKTTKKATAPVQRKRSGAAVQAATAVTVSTLIFFSSFTQY